MKISFPQRKSGSAPSIVEDLGGGEPDQGRECENKDETSSFHPLLKQKYLHKFSRKIRAFFGWISLRYGVIYTVWKRSEEKSNTNFIPPNPKKKSLKKSFPFIVALLPNTLHAFFNEFIKELSSSFLWKVSILGKGRYLKFMMCPYRDYLWVEGEAISLIFLT